MHWMSKRRSLVSHSVWFYTECDNLDSMCDSTLSFVSSVFCREVILSRIYTFLCKIFRPQNTLFAKYKKRNIRRVLVSFYFAPLHNVATWLQSLHWILTKNKTKEKVMLFWEKLINCLVEVIVWEHDQWNQELVQKEFLFFFFTIPLSGWKS